MNKYSANTYSGETHKLPLPDRGSFLNSSQPQTDRAQNEDEKRLWQSDRRSADGPDISGNTAAKTGWLTGCLFC